MRPKLLICVLWTLAIVGCDRPIAAPVPNPRIEALIERLASQNPPPTLDPEPWSPEDVHIAPTYDIEKQRIVTDACNALENLEVDAFPYLIQHLGDERFSCTSTAAVYFNRTVGDMCRMLITSQVDIVYGPTASNSRDDACDYFRFRWNDNLHEWWAEYRDGTLLEMQIDCLDFKISRAAKLGLTSDDLQKTLTKLRATGKSWQTLERERNIAEGSESFHVYDVLLFEHDGFNNPSKK